MTIYYVVTSGGSYSNDGLSVENAFDTIQQAADIVVAGDEVKLCTISDGETFTTDTFPITLATSGTSGPGSPIQWSGANSQGSEDGTFAVIDADGGASDNTLVIQGKYNYFQYIRILNSKGNAFYVDETNDPSQCIFYRCQSLDAATNNFSNDTPATDPGSIIWIECYSRNSGTSGFRNVTANSILLGCVSDSDALGFFSSNNGWAIQSIVLNSSGVSVTNEKNILYCTIYNSASGTAAAFIDNIGASGVGNYVGNLFIDNTGAGINISGANEWINLFTNGFFNNGSEINGTFKGFQDDTIPLSTSPFGTADKNNFSLDHTQGGLQSRNVGLPSAFSEGLTTSFTHLGAVVPKERRIIIG